MKDLGILFSKEGVLKLLVCNSFSRVKVIFRSLVNSVEITWVLDDNVQPHVRFNHFHYVSKFACGDAFNGLIVISEWDEKKIQDLR